MRNSKFRETLPLEILADMALIELKDSTERKWYCPDNACMNLFIQALKKVGVEEYRLDGNYIAVDSDPKLNPRTLGWINSEYARILYER